MGKSSSGTYAIGTSFVDDDQDESDISIISIADNLKVLLDDARGVRSLSRQFHESGYGRDRTGAAAANICRAIAALRYYQERGVVRFDPIIARLIEADDRDDGVVWLLCNPSEREEFEVVAAVARRRRAC